MLLGSSVMLIWSPVPVAVSGFTAYVRWTRLCMDKNPEVWQNCAHYNAAWSSCEYAAVSAQCDEAANSQSLGIKLRNAGLHAARNISSRHAAKDTGAIS